MQMQKSEPEVAATPKAAEDKPTDTISPPPVKVAVAAQPVLTPKPTASDASPPISRPLLPPKDAVAIKPTPELAPEPRPVVEVAAATPPGLPATAIDKPASPAKLENEPTPAPAPPRLDSRGFAIYSLPKRIDLRTNADLEKGLLAAYEVSLGDNRWPTAPADLLAHAKRMKANKQIYPGSMYVTAGRSDLAGLPFRMGLDSVLPKNKAQAMNTMSRQLRDAIQTCLPARDDNRPNTDDLFATLISEKKGAFRNRDKGQWASPEAVPCVVQMLQAENHEVRRMSCELLRKQEGPEATEALVKWAVFDTDAGNRAAAINALRERDGKEVSRLLSQHMQYPWPRTAEHASEALVALKCQDAIPQLAAAYGQPDPDAPFRVQLPNKNGGTFRQSLVRVNHLRNCILCHTPSLNASDLVRGAVPDPDSALPPPNAYYSSSKESVAAEITYLQQDFSLQQPVLNPGHWPAHQRFDYFVAIRRENAEPVLTPPQDSPYQNAIRFALKELSGQDPDKNAEWLAEQRKLADKQGDKRLASVAKFLALESNPIPLIGLKTQEALQPPLSMKEDDLANAVASMQKAYGQKATRLALIAYFDPLTRTGEPADRAKAARLLAAALGETPDAGLSKAIKSAVNGSP